MRFGDMFISYKIGLKGIKSTIPFTKLPTYRKNFMIAFLTSIIISSIFKIFNQLWASYVSIIVGVIMIIAFFIVDSQKNNLKVMLKEHYLPYSEKRMNMTIDVLKSYGVDVHDVNLIDMMIKEAQYAKMEGDYLAYLKKTFKILGTIIIPIIIFIARKIGDTTTQAEMISMAEVIISLTVLIFALIIMFAPIIKDIVYNDYNKYEELIYDLRQIKLFYREAVKM